MNERIAAVCEDKESWGKNASNSARAYCLKAAVGSGTPNTSAAVTNKTSIEILSFDNFSAGIAVDTVTTLSRNRQYFGVIHNANITRKGQAVDDQTSVEDLSFRCVVEGSVRMAVGQVGIEFNRSRECWGVCSNTPNWRKTA